MLQDHTAALELYGKAQHLCKVFLRARRDFAFSPFDAGPLT